MLKHVDYLRVQMDKLWCNLSYLNSSVPASSVLGLNWEAKFCVFLKLT